jgi:amino acid transporter
MFVDYLAYLSGNLTLMERWLIGVTMIGSVTWLNIRGTQLVGITSFLFTLFVLAPFAVMVLVGAPQAQASTWFASKTGVEVGLLLSIILWNSSGWDNAGCCAGEVRRPQQTYPRAMALSVLLVTFAYLLPLAVGVSANQNWADWKEGYFPEVAENIAGPWLGKWLMFAGLVSALGLFNALLCTSSRVPYAMARRRTLPHPLTKLHPHYNTPWVTIIINSVGAAVLIPFSFQDLVQVDMFLYALALVLEFASLVWLRIKEPDMPRAYRVPFGTPGAILISIPPVALCLISMALANEPTKLVSLGGIVSGLVVYAVGSVWRKHHEF